MPRIRYAVVETPTYVAGAHNVLLDAERASIVETLAERPHSGRSLGGGIRWHTVSARANNRRLRRTVLFLVVADVAVFLLAALSHRNKFSIGRGERASLLADVQALLRESRGYR